MAAVTEALQRRDAHLDAGIRGRQLSGHPLGGRMLPCDQRTGVFDPSVIKFANV
jgi:hypothetical protein